MRIQDDRAIWIFRMLFIAALVAIALTWPYLNADDHFRTIVLSIIALFIVSSTTFGALCTKLTCLGGVALFVGLFTLITGYGGGRWAVHTVERSSAIMPLIAGAILLVAALVFKRLFKKVSSSP